MSISFMSNHSDSGKRQYSQIQRRRCTQIINVIVGDGSATDGATNGDLIEGISNIGPPAIITIGPAQMNPDPLRSISALPQAQELNASGKRKSVTTYDGASHISQSSIPVHLNTSSASASSCSRRALSPHSISRSANDVSQTSSLHSGHYSSISTDPPRPAKDGHEWVWFPEGYWAEREIVGFATMSKWARRAANESATSFGSADVGPGPMDTSEKTNTVRPKLSRRVSGASASLSASKGVKSAVLGRLSYISPVYPHFISPDGEPEGLYCKTMRVLGGEASRRKRSERDSEITVQQQTPTPTKETLNGTSNYFSTFARKKTSTNPKSPEEETLSTKRKRLGIAPWHRKASEVSAVWSATSSIKNLLMPKTPMVSPHIEKIQQEYSGQYFQVDVSPGAAEIAPLSTPAPAGVNPLHMESGAGTPLVQSIRRVNTPPLVMEPGGKPRGFFFDLTPPSDPRGSNSDSRSSFDFSRSQTSSSQHSYSNSKAGSKTGSKPTTPHGTFSSKSHANINPHVTRPFTSKPGTPNGGVVSRQWWDGDEDTIVSRAERRPITRGSFVLDIPEHLPSSPLCPMHPKHKSGGKGICPFHGRRKTEVEGGARKVMAGFRN